MLSKYFYAKTQTKDFNERLSKILLDLKGKKVLLYGAGKSFVELDKTYNFKKKLNITAISDIKFKDENYADFMGIKTISPDNITSTEYDVILVTNESPQKIITFLIANLQIEPEKITTIFSEDIKNECVNYNYLHQMNFEKTYPKLIKKLKNKKIIIYGAGALLELINKYFGLSELDIIGISDKRYSSHNENETYLGYKVYAPNEIAKANPDYVLVSTINYIPIIEQLYFDTLKATNIKIKPLFKKDFLTLVKEIWN